MNSCLLLQASRKSVSHPSARLAGTTRAAAVKVVRKFHHSASLSLSTVLIRCGDDGSNSPSACSHSSSHVRTAVSNPSKTKQSLPTFGSPFPSAHNFNFSYETKPRNLCWFSTDVLDDDGTELSLSIYEMNDARIKRIEKLEDLEHLVRQLEEMPVLTAHDIEPLVQPLMRRTCECGERGAELTERILFHCLSRLPPDYSAWDGSDDDLSNQPYPSINMYNRTMIALGGIKSEKGAERAERIFQLMTSEYMREKQYLEERQKAKFDPTIVDKIRSPAPCRQCYKNVIRAWAISESNRGPARAYEILQILEERSGVLQLLDKRAKSVEEITGATVEFPDRAIYNTVISAYSRMLVVKHPIALDGVKRMVKHMDRLHDITGYAEFELDNFSYAAILRAYSNYVAYAPLYGSALDPNIATEIESVLKRVGERQQQKKGLLPKEELNVLSVSWAYGVLVDALAKTEPKIQSLQRAEAILLGLMGRHGGMRLPIAELTWPRHDNLNRLVKAWERTEVPEKEKQQRIDSLLQLAASIPYDRIYMLNAAMEEWIKSDVEDMPRLLEAMLDRALGKSSLRREMTGQTFAIVMKAWLRSTAENAPYRAEVLLQRMLELNESRGRRFEPREVHLRYVMTSWLSRCCNGQRYNGLAGALYPAEHAEQLVLWLYKTHWITNLPGHFALAIRAWSKQVVHDGPDEPNVVQHAASLLNKLYDCTGELASFPCNWVLETCLRPQPTLERRREAYNTAVDTFKRGKHNARSFVLLIKVLKQQVGTLDDDHIELVEGLFQECCSVGMLTQEMCWVVADIVSPQALQRLFGISYEHASSIVQVRQGELKGEKSIRWNESPPSALLVENLPAEWSRVGSRERTKKTLE